MACQFFAESKCGALSPPSSMSLIRAKRLTLSFPFKIKSKIILFTSFTNSLFTDIKLVLCRKIFGEQGWGSGESARLPPMWLGFDSRTRRHMWVEFVVASLLCSERFFSGYSGFPLSSKTNISEFQFDPGMHGHILNEFLRTPRCSVGKKITITLHTITFFSHT